MISLLHCCTCSLTLRQREKQIAVFLLVDDSLGMPVMFNTILMQICHPYDNPILEKSKVGDKEEEEREL